MGPDLAQRGNYVRYLITGVPGVKCVRGLKIEQPVILCFKRRLCLDVDHTPDVLYTIHLDLECNRLFAKALL